jgi:hypothetical protein
MDLVPRLFLSLSVLAACAAPAWSRAAAAQDRAAGPVPVLRGTARMGCGVPMPRAYALATPGLRPAGSGTYAAPPQRAILRSAELVGTLELRFGAAARQGTAEAERPLGGTWSVTALGSCTGGRGPLEYAVITSATEGRPARFDLRGPASHIQRPGTGAADEGGVVRFIGTCGRRQEVIMEIWPARLETAQGQAEPERYRLVGTVNCAAPDAAPPADSTATATP